MADRIRFTITWDGDTTGRLVELLDNGKVIVGSNTHLDVPGTVTVGYDADSFPTHRLAWTLWTLTHQVRNLRASASVNGGAEQELGTTPGPVTTWNEQGVAT